MQDLKELAEKHGIPYRSEQQAKDVQAFAKELRGDVDRPTFRDLAVQINKVVEAKAKLDKAVELVELFLGNSSVQVNHPHECELAEQALIAMKGEE